MKKDTNQRAALACAFTLAELLMAVLVISIIMVALAPVITRRAYDNVSIEVNKKKGLEIYTNPGTYTFDIPVGINTLFLQGSGGGGGGGGATYIDKSVSITSNNTWTVPKGVSQLTFTITGSGGGGGAGYAKATSENCVNKTTRFNYLADNGKDMCISEPQDPPNGANSGNITTVPTGTQCSSDVCCWTGASYGCSDSPSGGISGCGRTLCKYRAAASWCSAYNIDNTSPNYAFYSRYGAPRAGRLITKDEAQRILDRDKLGYGGIETCYWKHEYLSSTCTPIVQPYNLSKMATCTMSSQHAAPGSANSYAYPSISWLNGGYTLSTWFHYQCGKPEVQNGYANALGYAFAVFCAYELDNWNQFSGAGGSCGAKSTMTIKVLPNDTLAITIGSGGTGGSAGASASNGSTTRIGNGRQGGTTQIIHKRGSTIMGTYYVKGGFGGLGATASDNGGRISTTTPSGTCFAQYKNDNNVTTGGNVSCNVASQSGNAGSSVEGGQGAGGTSGGRIDSGNGSNGTGHNASSIGFGGGGGTCARGIRNPSSCSKGGNGGAGKVDISYRVMLPGSGGGSSTRVGGSKLNAGVDTQYEIKYKVNEGSRLVFEVGAGGMGGPQGQNGGHGTPTVIGDNKIIFLAGEGGKSVSQSQKNSLSTCIGSNSNSNIISDCINNINYKAQVGRASYVSINSTLTTNALGLIVNDGANTSYTLQSNFKGKDGKMGAQSASTIPFTYGFDGGVGGSPFGIRTNSISLSLTCGGGISGTYGTLNDVNTYICTSGSPDGNNAKTHNPVNNEFGGSGGGGGGVVDTSFTLGSGGNGSSGYLRIRWDETEQE